VLAPIRFPRTQWLVLREIVALVRRQHRLLVAMARREITDRFVGSFLGVVWSVLHPLILMGVYVVIFLAIFKARVPGKADDEFSFASYMISAYLPWMTFADVLNKSGSIVADRPNLVKQVVFPLEVLPLKGVLASLLPQLVGTAFLLLYGVFVVHRVPATWLAWPALFACEVLILSGVALGLSAIGVYFRDLKEIAAVASMISFYTTPILYDLDMAPRWIVPVLLANPLTWFVWPFRDACWLGRVTGPGAWIALPLASVVALVLGYRTFRRLKPHFANAL